MGRLVAVDLETSGLDPEYHEIIEVGLVWHNGLKRSEMEFSLGFDIAKADPNALEVNGWGKREFGPTVDPGWAAGFLTDVLDDAHLVGKNPASFDMRFLDRFLRTPGVKWEKPWHHRAVDVGNVAMGVYGLLEPPNTERVIELTGIQLLERHSALADARWAWEVLHFMIPGDMS